MSLRAPAPLALILLAAGCQALVGITDTTRVAGDGAVEIADASLDIDAPVPDAPLPDAPLPDAALPDAALPDAALPDARPPDARLQDATVRDACPPDVGSPDACGICNGPADCPAARPVCSGGRSCTTCTTGDQCAARAALTGDGLDHCGASGSCVECTGDDDCGGPKPVCNVVAGQCVSPVLVSCASMNVSGGMVAAPNLAAYDPSGSFTVEAWIYPLAYPDIFGTIVAHSTTQLHAVPFSYTLFLAGSGKLAFSVANLGTDFEVDDTSTIPLSTWTHVAGTFDAVNHTIVLWVNGVQKGTVTTDYSRVDSIVGPLTMGNDATQNPGEQFVGLIDEVRLSEGLTYTANFLPERHFMNATDADLALFHFDELSSQYAIDASKNANDGVLSAGAGHDSLCFYYRCGSVVTYGGDVVTNNSTSLAPGGGFTLEAYVFPVDLTASDGIDKTVINIVDRAQNLDGPFSYHMFIRRDGERPAFEVSCDGTSWITAEQTSGPPLPLDQWTHLAGTFNTTVHTIFLFRNGVAVAQAAFSETCSKAYDSGLPMVVASFFHGFGRFHGFVDELRLSSKVRYTADFASQVFVMPALEFTDVSDTLALYHYSDQGTIAQDSSTENNDAFLEGNVGFDTRCF
jgi:concanavalin A-like lectin/glucanase superfamily protein